MFFIWYYWKHFQISKVYKLFDILVYYSLLLETTKTFKMAKCKYILFDNNDLYKNLTNFYIMN